MDPPTWDISSPAVGDLATLCKSFYLSFMQFDHHVRHQSRHQHGQWNHTNSWNVDITPMFMCFRENIAIQPLQFQNHHLLLLDINDVSNFLGTHQGSTKCSPSCFCFWKDHHATVSARTPKILPGHRFLQFSHPSRPTHHWKIHKNTPFPSFPHLSLSADLAIHRAAWVPVANWRPPRRAKCGPATAAGATWPRPLRRSWWTAPGKSKWSKWSKCLRRPGIHRGLKHAQHGKIGGNLPIVFSFLSWKSWT